MAHRKPTAVLELRGSFSHNPSRKRERMNEPVVTSLLGDPPSRLTPEQKNAWLEIANNCANGVLTQADRHSLEIAAVLLSEFWANGANMKGVHLSALTTILSKFGMNPADRSKVTAPEQKSENPFAKHKRNR